MDKKIIIPVALLALGAAAFILFSGSGEIKPALDLPFLPQKEAEKESQQTPMEVKEEAWALFERYLVATGAHDLAVVKEISYQLSAACQDASRREECNTLMDNAYSFGSEFRKEDMTETVFDQKQVILSGPFHKNLEGEAPSITRGVLYFVRGSEGALKFLSLKPFDGAFIIRTDNQATSTIEARLEEMVADSDRDWLADEVEKCTNPNTVCEKTDPNKRDTDGDGWWDGIEALFYK